MSNIDDQVKVLSDQLNLSPDQQSKVKSILTDQHDQAMALIQDNSMAREAKVEKIHSLRTSTISKVREVLKDDQKTKFDQMVQQQDEHLRQQQNGTSNAPASTPPSGTKPPQ
jgi:vacuolar-type H+-ATPase subunit E/Vma4